MRSHLFNHLYQPEGNPYGPDQARSLGGEVDGTEPQAPRRVQWAVVHKGATLFTALAVQGRDWVKARQGEELMAMASGRAGLDAALLSAVFGGEIPVVDMNNRMIAACFEAGKVATEEQLKKARELVLTNRAQREELDRARRSAEQAERTAAAAQVRAEATSARMAVCAQNGIDVGGVAQVTWTYKQSKRDVATTKLGLLSSAAAAYRAAAAVAVRR